MNSTTDLASDLAFIRERIGRAKQPGGAATIYFLWAGICLVGFVLTDLNAPLAGAFWAVAGPAGALASGVLGYRWSRRMGQVSKQEGFQHAAHWGGMMGAIVLSQILVATGTVPPESGAATILLIVSLGYFYGGLHLERPLLWLSGLQLVGYLVVVLSSNPPWTLIGIFLAIGFAWVGRSELKRSAGQPQPHLVKP